MVVTLRTSQPSLSIRTDTMALYGLAQESIEFACLRSSSSPDSRLDSYRKKAYPVAEHVCVISMSTQMNGYGVMEKIAERVADWKFTAPGARQVEGRFDGESYQALMGLSAPSLA